MKKRLISSFLALALAAGLLAGCGGSGESSEQGASSGRNTAATSGKRRSSAAAPCPIKNRQNSSQIRSAETLWISRRLRRRASAVWGWMENP